MKKLIFVVLSFIWLGIVALYIRVNTSDFKEELEYTIYNDYTFVDNDVYITENTGESGYLYHIGNDYHVKKLFRTDDVLKKTWAEQVAYSQGNLYLLVMAKAEDNGEQVEVFDIIRMNPDTLEATECTPWMKTYNEGVIADITIDDEYIYMTQLIENRTQACVYAISLSDFSQIDDLEELNIRNVKTIRYSDYTQVSDGYYYVYASFSHGSMSTVENGSGPILSSCFDEQVADLYNSKIISWDQFAYINRELVNRSIMMFIAGELLWAAIILFFHRRNRVGYMIFIWELMLCIVMGTGVYALNYITRVQNQNQGVRYAKYAMTSLRDRLKDIDENYENNDDFYNSEKYRSLVDSLEELNYSYDDGKAFLNILVVDTEADTVIAAGEGFDRCAFRKLYGSVANEYVQYTMTTGETTEFDAVLDGKEMYFACMGELDSARPSIILVGVFDMKEIYAETDFGSTLTALVVILFILASLFGCIVLLMQSFDLHRIGDSMEKVAAERKIKKPYHLGSDVGDMWSGLLDIDRSFKNTNYKKYKLYEAYYRFAPKAVAALLGRDSVSEVNNGDSVKSFGTVASYKVDIKRILAIADDENMIRHEISDGNIRMIMELVNEYQKKGLTLQVSSDSDMSDMKFIMPEDNKNAIDFGVEFHKELQLSGITDSKNAATIFMHYSEFIYGVAGTEEHAMQVMIAPDYIKLENYLDVLTELKLRLVVTGAVYERENEVPANRFIGYFDMPDTESIALYEILEACPDAERRMKQECDDIFQKALELFFKHEFYNARNSFAHILKRNPEDTVARWYVFACEKYLENGTDRILMGLNQKLEF